LWRFEKGLKATVMSTELIIEANVSKLVLYKALHFAREFESKYSAYQPYSLLNKINDNAGLQALECTPQELDIFEKSLIIAQKSNGIFDPTIGVITQGLFGFGKSKSKIPTEHELATTKKLVNYKKFQLTPTSAFLTEKGMRLDLGGIGKGYVADKIIQILQDNGATKGFVSVGGEISAFGKKFTFAIKDPFCQNDVIALLKTSKEAISIATSGDYERFIKSQKYHHILNGTTAKQNYYYTSLTLIKNGIYSTSLDAITTIVFNSPPQELEALAKKYEIAIIAISHKKKIIFENYIDIKLNSLELFAFK